MQAGKELVDLVEKDTLNSVLDMSARLAIWIRALWVCT